MQKFVDGVVSERNQRWTMSMFLILYVCITCVRIRSSLYDRLFHVDLLVSTVKGSKKEEEASRRLVHQC